MSAYAAPLSGLTAMSDSLNVIANNLANLNTDGYKNETLDFASTLSGVQAAGTSTNFSNGNLASTGVASNMALQGSGFFVVKDANGNDYTRNGDFTVNNQGQLCTQSGQLLMGYPAVNGIVQAGSALAPIDVGEVNNIPASATTSFEMTTNLDASATVGTTYDSPITVYDSLGEPHALTIQYTNTAANTWTYSITLPAADTGGTGDPTQIASGTLKFDPSGVLASPTGSVNGIAVTGLADGASDLSLAWNLDGSGGAPAITQQASASTTSAQSQNGYTNGTFTGYQVLTDGTVQGQFSNEQTLDLGQVAVANFANSQGLIQVGDNDYLASYASGAAVIGQGGTGGRGTITGGSVENSNVDLSAEFANMIVAQQGYEANSKVLTTFDQLAQTVLQEITG